MPRSPLARYNELLCPNAFAGCDIKGRNIYLLGPFPLGPLPAQATPGRSVDDFSLRIEPLMLVSLPLPLARPSVWQNMARNCAEDMSQPDRPPASPMTDADADAVPAEMLAYAQEEFAFGVRLNGVASSPPRRVVVFSAPGV